MKFLIDAGHGGTDPGAIGKMSFYGDPEEQVYEKDLNIAFAESAKSYLENYLDATVYMGRTSDNTVSINDRSAIAHNNSVDAVISIHFNSFSTSTPHGTETYYAATRTQDKNFAQAIQGNVSDMLGTNDRGAKTDTLAGVGSLGILRNHASDTYPRALVEVQFISNTSKMNEIGADYYETTLDFALAIVYAMRDYFNLEMKPSVIPSKENRLQMPELKARLARYNDK